MQSVLSYGGGRQTVAICVLMRQGKIRKPDRVVMADTGRENPMTWEYLRKYVDPMLDEIGVKVEVAGHELATVDLYAKNGDLLLPVYTKDGKLPTFCSNEWKRRVVERHLSKTGTRDYETWVGFSFDESRRYTPMLIASLQGGRKVWCPLVDLKITSKGCEEVVRSFGLPAPHTSSCWMCPHKSNEQWMAVKRLHPKEFEMACEVDREIRETDEENGGSGLWVHKSRKPLAEVDFESGEGETGIAGKPCRTGDCFT